jgi:hypothetical protein
VECPRRRLLARGRSIGLDPARDAGDSAANGRSGLPRCCDQCGEVTGRPLASSAIVAVHPPVHCQSVWPGSSSRTARAQPTCSNHYYLHGGAELGASLLELTADRGSAAPIDLPQEALPTSKSTNPVFHGSGSGQPPPCCARHRSGYRSAPENQVILRHPMSAWPDSMGGRRILGASRWMSGLRGEGCCREQSRSTNDRSLFR